MRKSFLDDDSARVPFVVIGIFMVIISTVVSINLTRLDIETTTLATGVARQVNETYGAHEGYESSAKVEDWGEPVSMKQIGVIAGDSYVPGNLEGEIWEVAWRRNHAWRHYYVVFYPCGKAICSRVEYNEMTTTDNRMDTVAITLQAKENSNVNINLNYIHTILRACLNISPLA